MESQMKGGADAHAYERMVFVNACEQWFAIAILTFNIFSQGWY